MNHSVGRVIPLSVVGDILLEKKCEIENKLLQWEKKDQKDQCLRQISDAIYIDPTHKISPIRKWMRDIMIKE